MINVNRPFESATTSVLFIRRPFGIGVSLVFCRNSSAIATLCEISSAQTLGSDLQVVINDIARKHDYECLSRSSFGLVIESFEIGQDDTL